MRTLVDGAGFFIWPLGICSFLAVFIVIERLLALRPGKVLPEALLTLLVSGALQDAPRRQWETSPGGRILNFFRKNNPDPDTLKAFAQVELTRLERGLFLLDTIVGVAPLIGLLGTVYGLFILFPDEGMPNSATLTRGVGMALTTTILGLLIAIPSLVSSNYIARRLEVISARMNMAVERLCSLGAAGNAHNEPPPLPQ
ncbi:MAG: MotA/TolQ/ExbB proton channel family protein [Puniceicoccales bacterium]|jgi:biopolymer transport protein ExbB|nr:MotA/TolQ/ExbB proton channel family protein [Puniceicoccales bacterium]